MLIPYSKCLELSGNKTFDYVFHIGAHLGEEAQDYKTYGVKKTYWFEANEDLFEQLKQNINQIKPINNDNFYNYALYNVDDKEIEFKITNNGQSSSILELGTHSSHYPHISVTKTVTVKTKKFETLYKEHKEDFELDGASVFLNLDVQGVEFEVLQGFGDLLTSTNPNFRIDAIYTEVNFEEVYKGAKTMPFLNVLLGNYGFVNVATQPTQYGWGDALYVRRMNK